MQSTPFQVPEAELGPREDTLRRSYLNGSQPLWKAFWFFYVAGTIGLYALLWVGLMFIGDAIIDVIRYWNELLVWRGYQELHALSAMIPQLLYACLSLVVVWRCSKSAQNRVWRLLARAFVSLPVLLFTSLVAYCVWVIA